jgi:c-di-GMP-related signal transduction protein
MKTLVESMELAPDLRAALLKREDFFGAVLSLVEAYEEGRWDRVDLHAATVGVGPVTLGPLYLKALAWATEHARPRDDQPTRVASPAAIAAGGKR